MLSMIYLFWTEEECDDKSNVSDGVMRLFGSGFLSGRRTRGVKRTAAAFQPGKTLEIIVKAFDNVEYIQDERLSDDTGRLSYSFTLLTLNLELG